MTDGINPTDALSEAMTAPETARLLDVHVNTLQRWRNARTGPPYVRKGGRILYLRSDVDAWLRKRYTDTETDVTPS